MTDKTTPAFPCEWYCIGSSREIGNGMTLRDYFAAKAMQGIMNSDRYVGTIGTNRYEYNTAKHAYQMADAMMEARK